MSRLLLDEKPLVILPGLASAIGLNESIVLQQIHYWLLKKLHFKDGKYWVYNSYQEWEKQFPFFSARQIQYAIKNLEAKEILITANYNKVRMDRTKWYTINYCVLDKIFPFDNFVQTFDNFVQTSDTIVQTFDTDVKPIPETTTETTTDKYIKEVFDFWNNQKIVIHKKLTDKRKNKITKSLGEFSIDEIKTAISTYSEILKSEYYYFSYSWNLEEFLQRGLEKFINPEIAKQNYKNNSIGKKNVNNTQTESITLRLVK